MFLGKRHYVLGKTSLRFENFIAIKINFIAIKFKSIAISLGKRKEESGERSLQFCRRIGWFWETAGGSWVGKLTANKKVYL